MEQVQDKVRPDTRTSPVRIRKLGHIVLQVQDVERSIKFYTEVMRFDLYFEIADSWIELRVGGNILALARPGLIVPDLPPPAGTASVQLAFRVRREEVDAAEAALRGEGIAIVVSARLARQ